MNCYSQYLGTNLLSGSGSYGGTSKISSLDNETTRQYNASGMTDKASDSIFSTDSRSCSRANYRATLNAADDAFTTGLKEGIPLFGLFGDGESKEEIMSRQQNNGKATMKFEEQVPEAVGSAVGGALTGGVVAAAATGVAAATSATTGIGASILTAATGATGLMAGIGAVASAACPLLLVGAGLGLAGYAIKTAMSKSQANA